MRPSMAWYYRCTRAANIELVERAAAQAAEAAIAEAADENDKQELLDPCPVQSTLTALPRSKRVSAPQDPEYGDKPLGKTKSKKKATILQDDGTSHLVPHVFQPAHFDRLPLELRRIVLSYLERSPYSMIALQLVSKSWYLTLSTGANVDKNWERRCRALGAQKRSPGCKTWRLTYLQIMRRRCMICLYSTTAKLGGLLPSAPYWVVVCETCQFSGGNHPFRCITAGSALAKGISSDDLGTLPMKWRKSNNRDWIRDYLKSSVMELIARRARELKEEIDDIVSLFEGDQDSLRQAIVAVKKSSKSPSAHLENLVNALFAANEVDQEELKAVREHWISLQEMEDKVKAAKAGSGLEGVVIGEPELYEKIYGRSYTYLEGLVSNKLDINQYIAYLTDRRAFQRFYDPGLNALATKNQACSIAFKCSEEAMEKCPGGRCRKHACTAGCAVHVNRSKK